MKIQTEERTKENYANQYSLIPVSQWNIVICDSNFLEKLKEKKSLTFRLQWNMVYIPVHVHVRPLFFENCKIELTGFLFRFYNLQIFIKVPPKAPAEMWGVPSQEAR